MIQKYSVIHMRYHRRTGFQAVLYLVLVTALQFPTVAAEELSVPVKVLSSGIVDTQQSIPALGDSPPTQPTLPGSKLPQYQLGHHQRVMPTPAELKNPRQRFLLALPTKLILIEATITIDQQPFHMIREQRIQQIIEEASRSGPAHFEKVESESEETAVDETIAGKESENSKVEIVAEPTDAPDKMGTTIPDRVRRYVETKGEAASADEIRWLITNWIDGPTLLFLNDNFQRFRANQRPAFNILDRDRDGTVSADELALAVASFQDCDRNRNDIVDYIEIAKVAGDPRLQKPQHAGTGKIIFPIPNEKSKAATYNRIAACYSSTGYNSPAAILRFDLNSNENFDGNELIALREAEPDLMFTVSFNSTEPTKSRLSVTSANDSFSKQLSNGSAQGAELHLSLGGTMVTFSAVQAGASEQISIGAVNDGYPILPVIDPNEDGRFTIRELRGLVASLQAFDLNQDGNLTTNETPATIRICFGLGPLVHRELVGLRQLNTEPKAPSDPGPEWFVRMDRNKDNDLTRGEFPGTDEQFKLLDTDQDTLISAAEARSENK